MRTTSPETAVLHTDPEHSGVRFAVITALFVALVGGYIFIRFLLQQITGDTPDYAFVVSCLGSLLFASLSVWFLEKFLKQNWHSGRSLTLNQEGIQVNNQVQNDMRLRWGNSMVDQHWWFKLSGYQRGGRERRLPANWVCLASQLQQADKRLIVYTYMAADKADAFWHTLLHFEQIDPKDVYETSLRSRFAPPQRPDISSKVLSGANGRYWLAEKNRWESGYELSPEDYATFLTFLQQHAAPSHE